MKNEVLGNKLLHILSRKVHTMFKFFLDHGSYSISAAPFCHNRGSVIAGIDVAPEWCTLYNSLSDVKAKICAHFGIPKDEIRVSHEDSSTISLEAEFYVLPTMEYVERFSETYAKWCLGEQVLQEIRFEAFVDVLLPIKGPYPDQMLSL